MFSAFDSFKPYLGFNMSDINTIQSFPPANLFQDAELPMIYDQNYSVSNPLPIFPQLWDINKAINSEKSVDSEEITYMDDFLLNSDYDGVHTIMTTVSPNDVLPEQPSTLTRTIDNEDINVCVDMLSLNGLLPFPQHVAAFCDQILEDKPFLNDINNSEGLSEFENISAELSTHSTDIATNGSMETNTYTYHPDDDHCYFKVHDDNDNINTDHMMDIDNLWKSVGSPDSSGSSSEVDVVTVTEELQTPIVPKVQISFKNKRQKRGQKPTKVKKNNSLSVKTLNEAMKRNITRITTVRRTYRRRINNSVESTPPNSLPSSSPSSRCSSDVEDAGKRANHNSSERKRREVLRTNLQNLRVCVPEVQSNLKAPKVQVLNSARQFIRELQSLSQHFFATKQKELKKLRSLMAKHKKLVLDIS